MWWCIFSISRYNFNVKIYLKLNSYPSSNTSTNEIAINGTHDGCFFNAGQSWNATTRIYVHEKIYDEFVEKAIHKAKSIKLGGQFSPDTTQGPLISKKQMERVLEYIDSGVKEGAKLVTGGKRYGSKGFHVEPTIFADVKDDMKIWQEEIFGPVMSILKFSSLDDVIQRANDSQYGLAAGIFTNDINKAIYISNGLRVGQVWINWANAEQASTPFGGFKNSGIGRELGHQGIEAYLEDKTVIMSRPKTSLP